MDILRWIEKKRRQIGFSHNALIIIAMFSMLMDHIAFVLIKNGKLYGYDEALYRNAILLPEAKKWLLLYQVLRTIGRLAFPIYALLIVEGFRRSNNVFKYILRIFTLALISEIPFDLMIFNKFLTIECFSLQNVLFTYFINLLMLVAIRLMSQLHVILTVLPLIGSAVLCFICRTDYWIEGTLLIYIFYMLRNDLNLKCFFAIIVTFLMSFENYYGAAVASVFFIYFYDETKGYIDLKRFHYYFYPLHMLILYGIIFFTYWNK